MLEIDKIKEIIIDIIIPIFAVKGLIYFNVNIKIKDDTIKSNINIISKIFFIKSF